MSARSRYSKVLVSWFAVLLCGGIGQAGDATGYYKTEPQFHMFPDPSALKQSLKRFGPVGISLDLLQPAFTMQVTGVEAGSPADGKLVKGQFIESINGKVLKDEDPRVILGNLITEVEATDGVLKMMVKDDLDSPAREVVIQIPVLGAYSDTWPMNCQKSDTIVRHFADFLATHPQGWGSALFLLSTGEEKDLEVVRGWFHGKLKAGDHGFPWSIGYNGPAICEYYLRTGDETVIPAIEGMADYLKKTIYNGSWMGRGGANFAYMSGGHMNAAGVHCLNFLLLAKECGAKVDEETLQSCLYHFYRYAGHYNVSYGDGFPEGGGVDNGKNGGLAFAMAAAASLVPEGEHSVYAKARDINANKSFYTTSWLFHGHTGGGIGELWRGAAMGLMAEKRPDPYRSFMNERRWMYELARTWDGAFGWSSTWNCGYDNTGHQGGTAWGNFIPLIYTIPRHKLRIFGAPPTKYAKTYALPKRPWGTAADEVFLSMEAGEYAPGKRLDLDEERLPTHAAKPILNKFKDEQVSDEEILKYIYHPDSTSRGVAAEAIARLGRTHLIVPLLKSQDPRGRLGGLRACEKIIPEALTDEMIELAGGMVSDPEESWWVVMEALKVLALAPADKVAPYTDRIDFWLQHKDWWLRNCALQAATPLVMDKRFYKTILPIVGEMVTHNVRATALAPIGKMVERLQEADPEIQAYALDVFAKAYREFPEKLMSPGGQDLSSGQADLLRRIAVDIAGIPGGFDALFELSKRRFPNESLPHKDLYMNADISDFGPVVMKALEPILMDELIPRYMAGHREALAAEAGSLATKKPAMSGLVDLYNRLGVTEYDWHDFGPGLSEIEWEYYTFDPPEEKLWTPGWRYRMVTYPTGMEDWYKPEFDAAAAGWKKGYAPFGRLGDELKPDEEGCTQSFCKCGTPRKTFWDKEVLIMRSKITFPPLKENSRYRLCIAGMSHVNFGDGYRVYVNGSLLRERKDGVGKRQGNQFEGVYIDKSLWPEFGKEVTIAVTSFLNIPPGKRSVGVKRQHLSVFLQEMKNPPMDEVLFAKGMEPLETTTWHQTGNDSDRYVYDGNVVMNKAIVGEWERLGTVSAIGDFTPGMKLQVHPRDPLKRITLLPDGTTSVLGMVWTGDVLVSGNKALKMVTRTLDGITYLFIETGEPIEENMEPWESSQHVFKPVAGAGH